MPPRVVWSAIAILALTALFTCWCETPLIWDGAYQLAIMLRIQRPYSFEGRFHSFLLWLPVVPLSRITDNVHILQFVYGLPFAIAPALGLALSWWIVRREKPYLILWPIFGIAAATLPGQIFIINDSIFQQHLFWPIFLAVFITQLTRPQLITLALIAVFQFSHQIGIVLFAGAFLSAGLVSIFDRENRRTHARRALLLAALSLACITKHYLFPDSYAAEEATWEKARERWEKGVAGWPFRGLLMMYLSAACALAHVHLKHFTHTTLAKTTGALSLLFALVGAGMWIWWASDPHRWFMVIDFRRWVVPLTIPFFLATTIDACLRAHRRSSRAADFAEGDSPPLAASQIHENSARQSEPQDRSLLPTSLALLLPLTFTTVLTIQSLQWVRMSSRLMNEVRTYPEPLVPHDSFPWANQTALEHWATITYAMLMQGKTPEKLILNEEGFHVIRRNPPEIPYSWFHLLPPEPGPAGWFDHRPLVAPDLQKRRHPLPPHTGQRVE